MTSFSKKIGYKLYTNAILFSFIAHSEQAWSTSMFRYRAHWSFHVCCIEAAILDFAFMVLIHNNLLLNSVDEHRQMVCQITCKGFLRGP